MRCFFLFFWAAAALSVNSYGPHAVRWKNDSVFLLRASECSFARPRVSFSWCAWIFFHSLVLKSIFSSPFTSGCSYFFKFHVRKLNYFLLYSLLNQFRTVFEFWVKTYFQLKFLSVKKNKSSYLNHKRYGLPKFNENVS